MNILPSELSRNDAGIFVQAVRRLASGSVIVHCSSFQPVEALVKGGVPRESLYIDMRSPVQRAFYDSCISQNVETAYSAYVAHTLDSLQRETTRKRFAHRFDQQREEFIRQFTDILSDLEEWLPDVRPYDTTVDDGFHVFFGKPQNRENCLLVTSERPPKGFTSFYVRGGGSPLFMSTKEGGVRIKPRISVKDAEAPTPPRQMIPLDYTMGDRARLEVIPCKTTVAQYYLDRLRHRLFSNACGYTALVTLDDKVMGVISYVTNQSTSINLPPKTIGLVCCIAATYTPYRFEHLIVPVALQKKTALAVTYNAARLFVAASRRVQTTEITPYPESKKLRGKLKLVRRDYQQRLHANKLVYRGDWRPDEEYSSIYTQWVRKERKRLGR